MELTIIENAAREPEVKDLANMPKIKWVQKLVALERIALKLKVLKSLSWNRIHKILPDRIETVATYLVAAVAMTGAVK